MLVSIEGNISSGKSTLIRYLSHNEKYVIIPEPLLTWQSIKGSNNTNILEEFYLDPKRWSFSFQTLVYMSRINTIREAMNKPSNRGKIFITERSVYADKEIFAKNAINSGLMNELEKNMYEYMYKNWTSIVENNSEFTALPTCVVWVNTDPIMCYNRIKQRGRGEEKSVSIDYLVSLDKVHNSWLKSFPNTLTLDGNVDDKVDPKKYDKMIESIEKFIEEQSNIFDV